MPKKQAQLRQSATRRRIYVASSWRCQMQAAVVHLLRAAGHEVYDFRNPGDGTRGFAWAEIAPDWQDADAAAFREMLKHPRAAEGFTLDMAALHWCDTCVLVQPCGRSAHLELGWAVGAGKTTIVLLANGEPELMYRMVNHLCVDTNELLDVVGLPAEAEEAA